MRKIKNVLTAIVFIATVWVSTAIAQKRYTVSGYITEKGSRELLIGANVYVPEIKRGTTSNNYGFYTISLSEGTHEIYASYIGYRTFSKQINLLSDMVLNIELEREEQLDEVVVTAEHNFLTTQTPQMSNIQLPISQVHKIPALLGEKDVLKALQLMPGVQSGSEGSSGLYVRGGGPDQNLLILDDAPVYNASHLFGFFSIFNGDAIKNVNLTKGGFPARYGGRLSSVLDMSMKDGNKEKLSGEAGIGLISSRLLLEAPIIKGKSSFIISGRRTYIDLLTRPLMPEESKMGYFFYDLNAKINYDFGQKDKLYVSGYFGRDVFGFREKESNGDIYKGGLHWGNATATLRWNHLFNDRIFSNTSVIFSDYTFSISQEDTYNKSIYELKYDSGIKDLGIKYDMQLNVSPQYLIRTGLSSIHHRFRPSAVVIKDSEASHFDKKVQEIQTVESGLYVENELSFWNSLRFNAGIRYSLYGHKHKTYQNIEPRLSASYTLANDWAVKASYASMNQYVHLLSSSGMSLPMDLWVPTTDLVKPQHSQQVAVGINKDVVNKNLSISVEGYYKKMNDIIGYAPGANFLLIDTAESATEYSWEESVIRGQGWSYGVEFFLQRKVGKLSGWLGYTLSWTQHQFDEDNGERKFFPRYDRRHDISLVAVYNLSNKITLSGTWVYGTGNAISLSKSQYELGNNIPDQNLINHTIYSYGEKNDFRMRPYHRLDLAVQFHKTTKSNWKRTWEIGVYNAYSRRNPFFYQIKQKRTGEFVGGVEVSENVLEQYSIFPIIPSISYNLKF